MQKRKITKRQRKAMFLPNDMVQRSLDRGEKIEMSDRDYRGNPAPKWEGFILKRMKPALPLVRADR